MKLTIVLSSLLQLIQGGRHTKCIGPEGTHESVFLEPHRAIDYCYKPGNDIQLDFDIENKGVHNMKIYFLREDGKFSDEDNEEYLVEKYNHGRGFHSRRLKVENFESGKYVFKVEAFDEDGYHLCHAYSPIIYYQRHCHHHYHHSDLFD